MSGWPARGRMFLCFTRCEPERAGISATTRRLSANDIGSTAPVRTYGNFRGSDGVKTERRQPSKSNLLSAKHESTGHRSGGKKARANCGTREKILYRGEGV